MAVRRILYLSGTRADFGLMEATLRRIAATPGLQVQVAVTGTHLSPQHGHTVDEIRASGLAVCAEIPVDVLTRTGASMALAMDPGIAATARPSGLMRPAATRSALASRNAPVTAGQPPETAPVEASSAPAGVDQAAETGCFSRKEKNRPASPIAIDTAMSPEPASAGVPPAIVRPCTMTAKEPTKPTKAATHPATTGWRNCGRGMGSPEAACATTPL